MAKKLNKSSKKTAKTVKKTVKKKVEDAFEIEDSADDGSVSKKRRAKIAIEGDDLPPDLDDSVCMDTDKLVAEVEQEENKVSEEESDAALSGSVLPSYEADDIDMAEADAVLPSMEGMSILR
jgi:hypothetical protein